MFLTSTSLVAIDFSSPPVVSRQDPLPLPTNHSLPAPIPTLPSIPYLFPPYPNPNSSPIQIPYPPIIRKSLSQPAPNVLFVNL